MKAQIKPISLMHMKAQKPISLNRMKAQKKTHQPKPYESTKKTH